MRFRVIAPARLHFGLLQIDPRQPHCFGGIGLMLNEPELIVSGTLTKDHLDEVLFAESIAATCRMELATKVQAAAAQAIHEICPELTPNIQFQIEASPRLHTGLGTGTQLACCIATLVRALIYSQEHKLEVVGHEACDSRPVFQIWSSSKDSPDTPHHRLAQASGRGKRSHIGLEGFLSGGWIYDRGDRVDNYPKSRESNLARVERLDFPADWQVLLFVNDLDQGISGAQEQASFDISQHIENAIPSQMIQLATGALLPAIRQGDFRTFAKSIRTYNRLAGELFLDANPNQLAAASVHKLSLVLEQFGIEAYGQSSWGPTMWAILPTLEESAMLQDSLERKLSDVGLAHIQVRPVKVSTAGAIMQRIESITK